MLKRTVTFIFVALVISVAATADESPYAGEQHRQVKALSASEIDALLAGRGMGLARAAELNGYPGPKHVMELAEALELTDAQRARTAALFDTMQEAARAIGEEIILRETALDTLFQRQSITPEDLARLTGEIAMLQGRLRTVHLGAHLAQFDILTPEQRGEYARLRGYRPAP